MSREVFKYEIDGRDYGRYTSLRAAKRTARLGALATSMMVRVWAVDPDADECRITDDHGQGLCGHVLLGTYAADGRWTGARAPAPAKCPMCDSPDVRKPATVSDRLGCHGCGYEAPRARFEVAR